MTATRPDGETQVLASVRNAARLLREFGSGEPQLGVSDLARRLGIGKSTAHRLVHTLTAEGLLERVPATGRYRLSVAMQVLGASAQGASLLHGAATPVLDQLRNMTKETVQLAILDGRHVVYVERRESPQTIRLFGRIGHRSAGSLHGHRQGAARVPAAGRTRPAAGGHPAGPPHAVHHHQRRGPAGRPGPDQGPGLGRERQRIRGGYRVHLRADPRPGRHGGRGRVRRRPVQRVNGDNLRRFARPVTDAAAQISHRLAGGFAAPREAEPGEAEPREAI